MIKPVKHEKEDERLRQLESYSILDSLPERDYDHLTRLAAQICDTPVSLITLLDEKRQWFKSRHGLDRSETDRDLAFCAHAINVEDSLFLVEDARSDERFHDNPLVTGEPHIIFYAGVPLKSANGLPLGTLCVIDHHPHSLTEGQIQALEILSGQVMNLLELRKSRAQLEQALDEQKRFSKTLEDKVAERTKELRTTNSELERRNAELQSFAYISSHDLQEPLRKIRILSSQILGSENRNLSERGRYRFKRVQAAAGRMQSLIRDLLAYSRVDGKYGGYDEIDLRKQVENLREDFKEELSEGRGTLVTSENCHISAIPFQFRQVLYNLISNAIKFAKADEPLRIEITGKRVKGYEVADVDLNCDMEYNNITVSDNGIGFGNQYAKKIFNVFQRLNHKETYSGNGMGLAIVQKIVLNHGGSVYAKSPEKRGATFEIFLPVRPSQIS